MDEENKSPVDNTTSTGDKVKSVGGVVLGKIMEYKKVLIGIIAIILVVVLASSLLGGGKKGVIKDFVKAYNNGNGKKMVKCIDYAGMNVFFEMQWEDEDLEDFYDEYKDFLKSDDWEDMEEDLDEELEDMEDEVEEPDDDEKIKIKKFKDVKKEGKNLWKIEVEMCYKEDKDDDFDAEFYVMKKGFSYYIVGMDGASLF